LRRGELQALKWTDLDLEARLIHVRRSWDRVVGEVTPKSAAGNRVVPIVAPLLAQLKTLKETNGRDGEQFVSGKHGDRPFVPASVTERAANPWKIANVKRAENKMPHLEPIILHSCRHSFSTWLDHADVSEARADRYMGHSRATVASRYRHLRPEQIVADREKLDAYLAGAAAGKVGAITEARRASA
jgi:integrase